MVQCADQMRLPTGPGKDGQDIAARPTATHEKLLMALVMFHDKVKRDEPCTKDARQEYPSRGTNG
jgi:hypothetical protein